MNPICIIDTSVFVNLLNVPGRNNDMERITADYEEYVSSDATFILPMATIIQTGNHIAQNGDGRQRRETAQRFCRVVAASLKNESPYILAPFPQTDEMLIWLEKFPDCAGANKTAARIGEGTSFGDLTIIEEFHKCVARFPMTEVFIWSLDADLCGYCHNPAR